MQYDYDNIIYVNMQHDCVDMQHNYVNVRLDYHNYIAC